MSLPELKQLFARAAAEDRAVLMPYMMVGIPDATSSVDMFVAMADAGADAFEIGIPYADPLMDGPVIQSAGAAALRAGVTVERAFAVMAEVRRRTGWPGWRGWSRRLSTALPRWGSPASAPRPACGPPGWWTGCGR